MKRHPDCDRRYDAKTYTVQPYPKPNSRPKRSPVWKLCVKLKKGAELKCCHCGHSTKDFSNMRGHLKAVHPYEATMAGLFEVPAETEMGMSSKGKAEPIAWGEGRIDEINRIVALMVVVHGRPLEMVRNEVFVDLCRVLSGGRYSPCCTQTLRKNIDKLYENVLVLGKEKIAGGLHGSFSISVDGWTDVSMDPYCGLVLRFLDKVTLKRCKVLLGCMPWETEHDAKGTNEMIEHCLRQWEIRVSRISLAVTDNASVMVACIQDHQPNWSRLYCVGHRLQLTIAPGLDGTHKSVMVEGVATSEWKGKGPEATNELVRKVRSLTAFFRNSQSVKRAVAVFNADPEQDMDMKAFTRAGVTRWNGFLLQARRVLENQGFMMQYALDHNLGVDKYLTVEESRHLRQLLAVLDLFYEATQLFQATDEVSLSFVYPNILKLYDAVTITSDRAFNVMTGMGGDFVETKASVFVQEVKDFMAYLRTSLYDRWFGENGVFRHPDNRTSAILYGTATFLDPRHCKTKLLTVAIRTNFLENAVKHFFNTHAPEVFAFLQRQGIAGAGRTAASAAALASSGLPSSSSSSSASSRLSSSLSSSSAVSKGKVRGFAFDDSDDEEDEEDAAVPGAEGAAEGITPQFVREQFHQELACYGLLWVGKPNGAGEMVFKRAEGVPQDATTLCPYDWWATKRQVWPILSFLASLVLSIPASSADAERHFSHAGITMSNRRTSLDATRFNKMMTVQGNYSKELYKKFEHERVKEAEEKVEKNKKIAAGVKKARKEKEQREKQHQHQHQQHQHEHHQQQQVEEEEEEDE